MKFGVKKPIKILNSPPLGTEGDLIREGKGFSLIPPNPPLEKLTVSHIPYWTPENVVNHLNVEPFSHAHCVGPPLSVIARSPALVCFGHTLHTGDEAISSLMRKRRDCHASPSPAPFCRWLDSTELVAGWAGSQ
jgi:hypothetical protein